MEFKPFAKRRSVRACAHCRARKVRCNVDHEVPCYNCVTDHVACNIPERRPKARKWDRKKRYANTKYSDDLTNIIERSDLKHTWPRQLSPLPSASANHNGVLNPRFDSDSVNCLERDVNITSSPDHTASSWRVADFRSSFVRWLSSSPLPLSDELYGHLKLINRVNKDTLRSSGQEYMVATFQACLKSLEEGLAKLDRDHYEHLCKSPVSETPLIRTYD